MTEAKYQLSDKVGDAILVVRGDNSYNEVIAEMKAMKNAYKETFPQERVIQHKTVTDLGQDFIVPQNCKYPSEHGPKDFKNGSKGQYCFVCWTTYKKSRGEFQGR